MVDHLQMASVYNLIGENNYCPVRTHTLFYMGEVEAGGGGGVVAERFTQSTALMSHGARI